MTHALSNTVSSITFRLFALSSKCEAAAQATDRLSEIGQLRKDLLSQLAELEQEEQSIKLIQSEAEHAQALLARVEAVLDGEEGKSLRGAEVFIARDVQEGMRWLSDPATEQPKTPATEAHPPALEAQEPPAAIPPLGAATPDMQGTDWNGATRVSEPKTVLLAQPAQEPAEPPQADAPRLTQADRVLEVITACPWLTAREIGDLLPDIKNPSPAILNLIGKGKVQRVNNANGIYVHALQGLPEPEQPRTEQPELQVQDAPEENAQAAQTADVQQEAQPAESPATSEPGLQQSAVPAPAPDKLPAHLRPIPANVRTDTALRELLLQLAYEQGGRAMSESFYIGRLTRTGAYRGAEVTAAIRECVEAGKLRVVNGDKYARSTAVKA